MFILVLFFPLGLLSIRKHSIQYTILDTTTERVGTVAPRTPRPFVKPGPFPDFCQGWLHDQQPQKGSSIGLSMFSESVITYAGIVTYHQ